jgi:beta-lactam-binding protein with PASTA domain
MSLSCHYRFPAGIIPIDTIFAHVTVEPGRSVSTGSFSARMLNRPAKVFACSWIALVSAGVVSAQQPGGRPTATATRRAVVPQVTGITLDSARFVLGAFRLTPAINPTTPGQSIVRTQNPAAGQPIPTDRNVQLTVGPARSITVAGVSRGASAIAGGRLGPGVPRVTVPRVVGTASSVATRAIAAAGLKPAVRDTQMATPVPGIVVRQEPTGGDSVPPQTTVTIVVANGNQGGAQPRTVPNVTRHTVADARQILARDKLTMVDDSMSSARGPYGMVVRQIPGAGDPVPNNGMVRVVTLYPAPPATDSVRAPPLVVTQPIPPRDSVVRDTARNGPDSAAIAVADSAANQPSRVIPDSVNVPDVTGHTLAQALRILRSHRLRANYPVTAARANTVATELPGSGRVPVNTIVVLTLNPRTDTTAGVVPPVPPRRDPQLDLNPPIIVDTKDPEPSRLRMLEIVLGGIGVVGLGVIWILFRNPPPVPTPPQSVQSSSRDPAAPGGIPKFGTHVGSGTLDDNVQALPQPLIARSMELVPRLATVRSEIVGPFPAMQIIQKEGR